MPLNDRQIKNAKPAETGKKTKLFDGDGLYLEVTPAGGKVFRLKYRIDGKRKTLTKSTNKTAETAVLCGV
ncbi:Arm DNA-binding domain-containing protein [Neisseria sicca]|uniref:Arm DNA-binding domain-containing protein n=1 Tax=Neisseria sicca TaxID=490 RepID=UPI000D3260F0|nr:Arm DNA-binding domain-containing protein [Neisseria sicca]